MVISLSSGWRSGGRSWWSNFKLNNVRRNYSYRLQINVLLVNFDECLCTHLPFELFKANSYSLLHVSCMYLRYAARLWLPVATLVFFTQIYLLYILRACSDQKFWANRHFCPRDDDGSASAKILATTELDAAVR